MAILNSPTTATLTLLELPGTPYRLKRPMIAAVERDAAGFVVFEQGTGVFHYDADLAVALTGFFRAVSEQFEFLQRNEDQLAPSLQGELERFRSLLEVADTTA